MNTFTCTYI